MKIEETCIGPKQPVITRFEDIPNGTVFKYLSPSKQRLGESPFLRVAGGVVNLKDNLYYAQSSGTQYQDFTPFPAARVVLK